MSHPLVFPVVGVKDPGVLTDHIVALITRHPGEMLDMLARRGMAVTVGATPVKSEANAALERGEVARSVVTM